MANPFLMMSDEPLEADMASNPFLMQDVGEDMDAGDNPFLAGGNEPQGAYNPFAGFGDDDDDTNDPVDNVQTTSVADIFGMSDTMTTTNFSGFKQPESSMNFFDTTINESDDVFHMDSNPPHQQNSHLFDDPNANYSSEDELKVNKKPIPPRPTPPSAITQQLINSVADHLDQTSTHMLGRLPVTRSPSPISMRDLHSPSPTPDTVFGDFLDVGESNDMTSNEPQGEASFLDLDSGANDNPFADEPILEPKPAAPVPAKNPPRPPPPRPVPPRATASPITVAQSPAVPQPTFVQPVAPTAVTTDEEDFMDMFGTGKPKKPPPPAKPPAPKSKEDILSLFSTPKPSAAPPPPPSKPKDLFDDLMSGDIPEYVPSTGTVPQPQPPAITEPITQPSVAKPVDVIFDQEIVMTAPVRPVAPPPRPPPTTAITPTVVEHLCEDLVDEDDIIEMPQAKEETVPEVKVEESYQQPEPIPITITTIVTDELEKELQINVEDNLYISENSSDISATGSNITSAGLPGSVSGSVLNMTISENVEPSFYDKSEVEYDNSSQINPFGDVESVTPSYIDTMPDEPVMPVPAVDISVTKPLDNFMEDPDEFDAFAAKFEGTRKVSNAFMDDVPVTAVDNGFGAAVAGDAWGDSGFGSAVAAVADEGFGNEGYDDFMSMKKPPIVSFGCIDSNWFIYFCFSFKEYTIR
jgi:stonin-1/2